MSLYISGKEKEWHLEKQYPIEHDTKAQSRDVNKSKPCFQKWQVRSICSSVPPQFVQFGHFKGAIAEYLAVEDTETAGENRRRREKLLFPLWKCNSVP